MNGFIDISGQKFNRLTVIERAGADKRREAMWLCKCDCGNVSTVRGSALRLGLVKSCGCLQRENASKANTKHGQYQTRLYKIWEDMHIRCFCESYHAYQHYGGRGITICAEWRNSFEAFRDWAMSNGYKSNLSIDRIDVNGNYEPSNCRWATQSEQLKNRRKKERRNG